MQELDRLQKLISDIQLHNTDKSCLDNPESAETFYLCREDSGYIQSLSFDTPVQLSDCLKQLCCTDGNYESLIKTIVVLAFKLRAEESIVKENVKERIYNF